MNAGKKFPTLLLSILIAISSIVIIGWLMDIEIFKRAFPGIAAMHPVTAITFILAAIALILIRYEGNRYVSIFIAILSLCVIATGLLGIISYVSIYDLKIHRWLFPEKTALDITGLPSSIAPNTAINFIISGIVILYLNVKHKMAVLADFFALIIALSGLVAVLGYIYHAEEFYKIEGYGPMALNTAVCFILLSLSILSFKKQAGFTKEITSEYGGRKISILLIPIALIVPVVLGCLRLYNEHHHYFSSALNTALSVTTLIIILIFFTWKLSVSVNRTNFRLVQEIESKKKVETKLKESNIFLDTILDEIPAIVFVKESKELKYIRINKATEKFLNLKKEEVIGKTDAEIFTSDEAAFIREIDLKVLSKEEMVFTEEERINRNNQDRWLSTKKIPFRDTFRNSYFLIGIAEEITAQKKQKERILEFNKELESKVLERTGQLRKSESRFRSLIENGVDAIKMMDSEGFIHYASCSNKRVLGFDPEEMIRTNWLSYVHPDEKKTAVFLMEEALKEPLVPKQWAFRLLHKEGHYISAEGTITNFLSDESVKALVCNFHDITERLQIENEKKMLQKVLLEEKIRKQKQIANATIDAQEKERTEIGMELHDNINQLLGVIKLYIGMAIKAPSSTKEMLVKSHENIELCINEIRKLSKTLSGPDMKTGLINAIENLIQDIEEGSQINFTFSATNEIFEKIDERKQLAFYRILQELLTNVVKHAGAKNVFISFKEVDGRIIFNLKDDGKGFDIYEIRKGLGLKNIQNRVEALNGTFKITSAKDEGCNVRVTVPKN